MTTLRSYVGAFSGQQQQFVIALDAHLEALGNGGGKVPRFVDDPNQQTPQTAPPPAVSLNVRGIDGKFQWLITNPEDVNPQSVAQMRAQLAQGMNLNGATVLHNVQSATDTNFNNASNLVDYGTTSQVFGQDQRPNETRFFRIRSSFDGLNFNAWQVFSSAQTCGPVAVQSGFLRSTSSAPRGVVNNSNNATVDSVDPGGGVDTIRIYGPGGVGSSFTIFDGQGNQTTVPAGTIAGAAQSTFYQIVWSAATGFRAFPNATQYTQSLLDQYFTISGSLKTCAAGGAGGVSGGGGTTGGGGAPTGGGGNKLPQL